jgi:ATP-dependent DNA helicase 2 subunit 2
MATRVMEFVNNSYGTQYYDKAYQCLSELRLVCVCEGEAHFFNDAMQNYKAKLKDSSSADFWNRWIKSCGCTLISVDEAEDSSVTKEQAHQVGLTRLEIDTHVF